MALVNQALPGLYGGVSQQTPELRHDTQVTEMVNCYPTIIGGTTKRPPSSLVYNDNTFPKDSFIYAYDRGAGNEQYIICINSEGQYRFFDIKALTWINDWTYHQYLTIPVGSVAKESFSLSTVGDTTFVVNKTKVCSMINDVDDNGDPDWETNFYYWISRTAGDATDNATLRYTYTIDKNGASAGSTTTHDSIAGVEDLATKVSGGQPLNASINKITDLSYNKVYVYNASPDIKQGENKTFAIYISKLSGYSDEFGTTNAYINVYTSSDNSTWTLLSSTSAYNISAGIKYYSTSDAYLKIEAYSASLFSMNIDSLKLISVSEDLASTKGSILKVIPFNKEDRYSGSDSWGNQASSSWQGSVSKLQDLPQSLGFEGSVFKINGDADSSFDDYYVKYDGGSYLETFKPGLINSFDSATLPHKIELRKLDDGTYYKVFDVIEWESRKVGDDISASYPSFIGQTIQDVFFYRNRLGFISGDNVILSEAGEYYNFWPTTVTSVIDSDVVDVAVDSNKAISLQYATPFNKELLIFGDKAQFVMSAGDTLTPKDVSVQQSTAFDIKNVTPSILGPNAYFVSERNNYSTVREYYVQPDSLSNDAADITAHCPNYIPKNIIKLVGSSKNDMLFALSSETKDTVYVYNFYWNGEEKAQSAWHKWTFDGEIFNIEVLGSSLLLMIQRYSNVNLEIIPLEQSLEFKTTKYADQSQVPYESKIILTKPGFMTGNTKQDDIRGNFILRNLKLGADYGSFYTITSYRIQKDRSYYYNEGIGHYPGLTPKTSKAYEYTISGGSYPTPSTYPSVSLLPGDSTWSMQSDHKYPIAGNVNNLELQITNNITSGFKINTLDLYGTYVKISKNV
jgi:hypothetical protein